MKLPMPARWTVYLLLIEMILLLSVLPAPDRGAASLQAEPAADLLTGVIPKPVITKDEEGYTLWTVDWSDVSWCVPVSTLRYPIDLETQDPTQLSDASLILTFQEGGPYYTEFPDPSWGVAINGDPPLEWQIVGDISGAPTYDASSWHTQVVPFDAQQLVDGVNNVWLQQHDNCPREPGCLTCACTCVELSKVQLRAAVELKVLRLEPLKKTENVLSNQNEASHIRVKFTTPPDPDTVNEETFTMYYLDNQKDPLAVSGSVVKLSGTEFAFVPDEPLLDGIRYHVQVWGETEAQDAGRDQWVKDIGGGAMTEGQTTYFWTMPILKLTIEPLQVISFENLVVNKPTIVKVFVRSELHPNVWYFEQWQKLNIDDLTLSWQGPDGVPSEAKWSEGGTNWLFQRTDKAAVRKRHYDKYEMLRAWDSINYFGFRPGESGGYLLEATAELTDHTGEVQKFSVQTSSLAVATRSLRVPAWAIAVGSQAGKTGTRDLSSMVAVSQAGLKALFPAPTVYFPVTPSAVPYYDMAGYDYLGDDFSKRLVIIDLNASCLSAPGCTFMLGYAPVDWLKDAGLSLPPYNYAALVQAEYLSVEKHGSTVTYLAAHEAGHLYGFEHIETTGYRGYDVRRRADRRPNVASMEPQSDDVIRKLTEFMTVDPIEELPVERLWINSTHYRSLLEKLGGSASPAVQSISSDPLLLVSGLITETNGAVYLQPWYQLEPGEWSAPPPGAYELVFRDAGNQEIPGYTYSFAAATTLQPAGRAPAAPQVGEAGAFVFKVPYPATATRVQIRRSSDQAVLAERSLLGTAPALSLTPPASNTWSGDQTLTWSSGVGPRYYALQVSTDNGLTWQPFTLHQTAASYTLPTTSLGDSDQVWVKVLASDGVLTSQATAGPFSIDNPPAVAYASPAADEQGVPVEQPLYIGFNQAMDPATITTANIQVSGGPFGSVSGVLSLEEAGREAVFTSHSPLAYHTTYTIQVLTGARDAGGQALPAAATWSFTTEVDANPPRPENLFPSPGAVNTKLNTLVGVQWDQALLPASMDAAHFRLQTADGIAVAGAVTYDALTNMAVFSPTTRLAANTIYSATLQAGISDMDGNLTPNPVGWIFTTGEESGAEMAFSEVFAEAGVDADGDRVFEALQIQVGVQVSAAANYRLSGSLYDREGNWIAFANQTTLLQPGLHLLPLSFGSDQIGGHGLDGPYELRELTLVSELPVSPYNQLGSTAYPGVYRTQAFHAADFSTPLTFSGLPDVSAAPGRSYPLLFNVLSYASHNLLASDQLTYTLVENTDSRVGLILAQDGWLSLSPTSSWSGQSRITLRAADGVHQVQDSFAVAALPNIHLPLIALNQMVGSQAAPQSDWALAFADSFENGLGNWRTWMSISVPPGGWYWWDVRECAAHTGTHSAWPFGGNEDGSVLSCGAVYPNTLYSSICNPVPINLTYTGQAELSMMVYTDLAPGDEICLMVSDEAWEGLECWQRQYYSYCRSGATNGWEKMTLDLANVPGAGSLLGKEQVWIGVKFAANESEARPIGAYVDDVEVRLCPEWLNCTP